MGQSEIDWENILNSQKLSENVREGIKKSGACLMKTRNK